MHVRDILFLPRVKRREPLAGADPGFQVRGGGGGGALNKIVPSGGRRENFWGISCEKSYCFPILGGGGGAPGAPPPPLDPPLISGFMLLSVQFSV